MKCESHIVAIKMLSAIRIVFVSTLLVICSSQDTVRYNATWESLDTRPLPQWYDDAKFGIFIHWGLYSVPGFGSEWFWNRWASMCNKYVVLTTKHHEGYTLWPSKYSFSWNAKDVGPNRDLVGDFSDAIRKTDIKLGLYHSLFEFYNPLYLMDKANNYSTRLFADQKTIPEMYELVEEYEPDIFWSDGGEGSSVEYWQSREFISWLYNDSPVKDTIVVNDRWGDETMCEHGDFFSCADRYNPGTLQAHKWENCMTIDQVAWGYRRNAKLSDYLSIEELIYSLVSTVSTGGNLLLNIAPDKDGVITPIFEERLRDIGSWLTVNGEAIYSTVAWSSQLDSANSNELIKPTAIVQDASVVMNLPEANSKISDSDDDNSSTPHITVSNETDQLEVPLIFLGKRFDVEDIDPNFVPPQQPSIMKLATLPCRGEQVKRRLQKALKDVSYFVFGEELDNPTSVDESLSSSDKESWFQAMNDEYRAMIDSDKKNHLNCNQKGVPDKQ
uniref:alpha-L-fucosidase n=1 Tax=Timema cristinae TaxID=61476 RepID=A0A7R9CBH6_TIMCR|nr:unnamed protein product [Timema cristinae]